MPGSPQSHSIALNRFESRPIHPAALLIACALVGLGISLTHSPVGLALVASLFAWLVLRWEGRSPRAELPLVTLAAIVFLAHTLLSGRPFSEAAIPAALIALRLLALLYLLRWAARAFLGEAARWLLSLPIPSRPRALVLAVESGRHALALGPLALREAELQHVALRARGLKPSQGAAGRARYVAAWLLPFLGTMLRLGECYGESLAARGYRIGARRRAGRDWGWGGVEFAILLGGAAAAAGLIRGI